MNDGSILKTHLKQRHFLHPKILSLLKWGLTQHEEPKA